MTLEVSLRMDQTAKNDKSTSEGEVSMEKFMEEATQKVEQLKTDLIDRAASIEDLHQVAVEQEKAFAEEKAALAQEIDNLKKSLAESEKARDEAVSELAKVREEAMLKERISILTQEGLLRSDEESRTKQAEKVRAMNDEDFKSYVEDLVDTRKQALASASTNTESTENKESKSEEVVGSEESASGEETLTQEVLSSLAKPAASAEGAEKKEEAPSKESASVKSKIDGKRLSQGFSKMMTLNLKQDSENKEGRL